MAVLGSCTRSRSPRHGEEDVRLLDRCEAKRKEWAKHWQCDESVQNMEDKPWKNGELKKLEEALPRPEECDLERASSLYKTNTGVGCDDFHPKVSLHLTYATRVEVVEFLEKVEQSGKWPQQACTTNVLLDTKERYEGEAGCAYADVDTLVGSYEGF